MSAPDKFGPDDATLAGSVTARNPGSGDSATAFGTLPSVPLLEPGTVLAGRYEILAVLGQGGMGAVYKAQDRELDRVVALKTIRPEMASTAGMLARFKQEVLLASQITHENVVRLYDLGEGAGTKFVTMEFVEGEDLRSALLARGKLAPAEAVAIIRQVCLALQVAHAKGVIHRDLKPQNVMLENSGRVVVMDFGLARSLGGDGMTQTGALMGTMEYMSPEQAMAGDVDQRSDIFAVGLIFFELLTGKMPYQADTALASLLKRARERAVLASDIDNAVPRPLSNVVSRCLEPDRNDRYQTITELLADLEKFQSSGKTSVRRLLLRRKQLAAAPKWAALALVAVAIAAGIFLAGRKISRPKQASHAPVSVLVADFSNHTGDAVFDGTLEPVFNLALEGASFVNAYNRGQAHKIARKLPQPSEKLDEPAAQRVAVSQGLGVVIGGLLDRQGSGYVLSVRATQAVTGKVIGSAEATAASKDEVLSAVTSVASKIRKALGDDTSESAQRFAMETLTTTSLEAVHEYAVGMEAMANGNLEEALRSGSKAADLDPNFGAAYGLMAIAARNLGRLQDAEKYLKQAITHLDHMTERERYRVRGSYYLFQGDQQKCVEEYTALISRYSSDAAAHNNIALCSSMLRNMPKAIEEAQRAIDVLPQYALYRGNLAIFFVYAGEFQKAEQAARQAQQLAPSYPRGYLSLAFSQLGQGQLPEAKETYQKLEKFSPSDAASGLGDVALYEGRFSDAAKIFAEGAARDIANKSPDRAADKFAALAYTQLLRGQRTAALAAANSALQNSKAIKTKFLAARIFAAAGEGARARRLAAELAAELPTEPQAYAKLVEGEVALKEGNARAAVKLFTEGNNLLDTWIGRFDVGRAYLEAGAFTEADSEFDRCIKRRGEAMALFLDEVPTYGYFPEVYYYQGRVREGLKSPGAIESYRTYLSIREKTGEDPLLPEVRRRTGL